MKQQRKIKKHEWVLGFLGFMGLYGFLDDNPTAILFFAFFAFFSRFWDYKLQNEVEDERLIENRYKATLIAFKSSFSIIWLFAVFGCTVLPRLLEPLNIIENQYKFLLSVIAFGFAFAMILASYLTYRFDKKD